MTYSYKDGAYLIRTAMARTMGQVADEFAAGLDSGAGDVVVLDIGGRDKPYAGAITEACKKKNRSARYLVVDPGHGGDVTGVAEALPVASASVDLIISTQVLEHVADPGRAVSEMSRVLAPGGTCLLTTHGTWFYHPDPEDLWRWTGAGLMTLFNSNGFGDVSVRRVGGTKLSLSVLLLTAIDRARDSFAGAVLRNILIPPANFVVSRMLAGRHLEESGEPGELVINYLVTARPNDQRRP